MDRMQSRGGGGGAYEGDADPIFSRSPDARDVVRSRDGDSVMEEIRLLGIQGDVHHCRVGVRVIVITINFYGSTPNQFS